MIINFHVQEPNEILSDRFSSWSTGTICAYNSPKTLVRFYSHVVLTMSRLVYA